MPQPAQPSKPLPTLTGNESRPATLWQQLTPQARQQMTRQWAAMIQKIRQSARPKESNHV